MIYIIFIICLINLVLNYLYLKFMIQEVKKMSSTSILNSADAFLNDFMNQKGGDN